MSDDQQTPSSPAKRILVVDDDAFTRTMVQEFLTRYGYEVVTATDGADGLDKVRAGGIDMVVSDMIMPGRSGFELLTEIKTAFPLLPVIIITGKPKVEAAVACIKTGAFDYLTKPLRLTRFIEHVQLAFEAGEQLHAMHESNRPERFLSRWHSVAGYDLVKVLGEGGLGVVFLAEKADDQGQLQRYALKVLKPEVLNDSDMVSSLERFISEAELASAVIHPNIIRIHDYGLAKEEQIPYIVMDYVEGLPLSWYIANGGELDYAQKCHILRQAASALAAVHASHMLHRDIKPDNILVSADLHVTLTDFGIATSNHAQRLTQHGIIVGSPAYLSPEVYAAAAADTRSDIFALGSVAYELFLGIPPFDGDTLPALSHSIRFDPPPDMRPLDPDMPERLVAIVEKMLAKDPRDRYQTARGVVAAFDEFLNPNSLLKSLLQKRKD